MTFNVKDSPQEILGRVAPNRTLSLNESLGAKVAERLETQLNALNTTDGDILLTISCGGGNFYAGLDLYEVLRRSKNRVIGLVTTQAKSAGFMVLQGCGLRLARTPSELRIHNPEYYSTQHPIKHTTSEIEWLEICRQVFLANKPDLTGARERMIEILLSRSNFTDRRELEEFLETAPPMNESGSLAFGFLDAIVE